DDDDNWQRLSDALDELRARVRTQKEPGGLAFDHDGPSLAEVKVWNLVTSHGELDVTAVPSGTPGVRRPQPGRGHADGVRHPDPGRVPGGHRAVEAGG